MINTVLKYKGSRRDRRLPSCQLNLNDFKKLYHILKEKVDEIIDFEIEKLPPIPADIEKNEFEDLKKKARQALNLSIIIIGSDGEQIVDNTADILDKMNLPEKIKSITFDNSWGFKVFANREIYNKIILHLDLTKPRILDFSNPSIEPSPNKSGITVLGPNETWVSAVYEKVMTYLRNKKRRREWLYSQFIYEALLFLVAIPLIFWGINKLDIWLRTPLANLSGILRTAVYVWFFIAGMYIFRIFFNWTRWLFPLIEYESHAKKHRTVFLSLLMAIFGALIYDIIKNLINLFI